MTTHLSSRWTSPRASAGFTSGAPNRVLVDWAAPFAPRRAAGAQVSRQMSTTATIPPAEALPRTTGTSKTWPGPVTRTSGGVSGHGTRVLGVRHRSAATVHGRELLRTQLSKAVIRVDPGKRIDAEQVDAGAPHTRPGPRAACGARRPRRLRVRRVALCGIGQPSCRGRMDDR